MMNQQITHGWNAAISAAQTTNAANSLAILPPGFVFPHNSPSPRNFRREQNGTLNKSFEF